jgi:tetratricopeptide (TPR) repeat protein
MARRYKFFAVGWLWYLGTLVPVIGLIQAGAQAMADRYTYMTLTGLFIIIAWSAKEFVSKRQYKILALLTVAVLVIWGITAARQLRYWKDSLTLFEHTMQVTENNYIARSNYISCLYEVGRLDEAIEQFRELLKIKPDSAQTHNNFGVALLQTGRVQDAIEHFRLAIKYQPDSLLGYFNLAVALQNQGRFEEAVSYYEQALKIEPGHIASRLKLAAALNELGRIDEAVGECQKCLQIDPNDPNSLSALGVIVGRQGKFDEAVAHLTESLRLDPNSAQTYYYLGQVLVQRGKIEEAITFFEEALRLKPDWAEPMNDLAWFLAAGPEITAHNPDRAFKLAQRACELTNHKKPELLDTLAAAYAATGDFSKALETAEKALELCRSPEQETLKEEIKKRLALYKAGKPYSETR